MESLCQIFAGKEIVLKICFQEFVLSSIQRQTGESISDCRLFIFRLFVCLEVTSRRFALLTPNLINNDDENLNNGKRVKGEKKDTETRPKVPTPNYPVKARA